MLYLAESFPSNDPEVEPPLSKEDDRLQRRGVSRNEVGCIPPLPHGFAVPRWGEMALLLTDETATILRCAGSSSRELY